MHLAVRMPLAKKWSERNTQHWASSNVQTMEMTKIGQRLFDMQNKSGDKEPTHKIHRRKILKTGRSIFHETTNSQMLVLDEK